MNKLGFGCVALTKQTFELDALEILELAYDSGITYFDTAPLYGQGYSEKILGKFIKEKRNNITVATKFGLGNLKHIYLPSRLALPLHSLKMKFKNEQEVEKKITTKPLPVPYRLIDKKAIEKSFEMSLRLLKTDRIDNYLLHEGLPAFLTDDALQYLLNLKEKKMVGNLGIASGSINLHNLKSVSEFDILQYEGNIPKAEESSIFEEHPLKTHIHHSVLKELNYLTPKKNQNKSLAGLLLLSRLIGHDANYVLFSTTKKDNLIDNLKVIRDNNHLNYLEIKAKIADALY